MFVSNVGIVFVGSRAAGATLDTGLDHWPPPLEGHWFGLLGWIGLVGQRSKIYHQTKRKRNRLFLRHLGKKPPSRGHV